MIDYVVEVGVRAQGYTFFGRNISVIRKRALLDTNIIIISCESLSLLKRGIGGGACSYTEHRRIISIRIDRACFYTLPGAVVCE